MRILVADDTPAKLEQLTTLTRQANPEAVITTATSAKQAIGILMQSRDAFDRGVIDFDFPGEPENGADIVRTMRNQNPSSRITLATARDMGDQFESASEDSTLAGADATLSTHMGDFEGKLRVLVA